MGTKLLVLLIVLFLSAMIVLPIAVQAASTYDGYGCSTYLNSGSRATWALPLCLMEIAIAWTNDWLDDGTNWWY